LRGKHRDAGAVGQAEGLGPLIPTPFLVYALAPAAAAAAATGVAGPAPRH
jgi:hypothetical protein